MLEKRNLLDIAHELQALSSGGLQYTKDHFDADRFRRVRTLAAELVSGAADLPLPDVKHLFEANDGYQTPKSDTRAVIFNERDEVLLIHDYDGKWALPGGWCDYNQTVASNVVKEAKEEAGLDVLPHRLIAVHDHRRRNNPDSFFHVFRFFVLCDVLGGTFQPNDETTESRYFPLSALPENLNLHKNTPEQLRLCLEAKHAEHWETQYD